MSELIGSSKQSLFRTKPPGSAFSSINETSLSVMWGVELHAASSDGDDNADARRRQSNQNYCLKALICCTDNICDDQRCASARFARLCTLSLLGSCARTWTLWQMAMVCPMPPITRHFAFQTCYGRNAALKRHVMLSRPYFSRMLPSKTKTDRRRLY